jgi:hypothetical protein
VEITISTALYLLPSMKLLIDRFLNLPRTSTIMFLTKSVDPPTIHYS